VTEAAPSSTANGGRSFDLFAFGARYGTLIALILLIIFNLIFTRNFATLQTLNVNLTQVCTIVIVATGMTLVIATGGIDLSVGSIMAIAGALAPLIFLSPFFGDNVALAVAVAIVAAISVAALCGLFNGWLVAQFRIQPIVATLVLFIAGRGIAQAMTNSNLQVFRVPEFQWIGLARL
jgi:galactofuranose transport system permease protein